MQKRIRDFVSKEILNRIVQKRRNKKAFVDFVNNRINNSRHVFQQVVGDTFVSDSISSEPKMVTYTDKMDDTIVTEEYCSVPFRFVQTETRLRKDGRKMITTFFPTRGSNPAKVVEISASGLIVKTTNYKLSGEIKNIEKVVKNQDGSGFKEEIEPKHNRRTVRTFNKYNIATSVKSYVNDKLVFELECDSQGELKKETSYYQDSKLYCLQKEVLYHTNQEYTEMEYSVNGRLCSVSKRKIK